MGRSVSAPLVLTDGRITHKLSGSVITIESHGSRLEQSVERHGAVARYPVAYSVGAGIVGYSYLVWLGSYLYQSPASYYTRTNTWDLTPGYETDPNLDFTRQITSGCLFCHTGSVNFRDKAANQFTDPPFAAISCERCHGPSAAHMENPIPGSILNPAKLPAARRDSICEQCHLEGVVRILNPGRDWWDFHPGAASESVFVTYLPSVPEGGLRAVSQSELLARSQCQQKSEGRLWCGSCHNPHAAESDRGQAVRAVCLSCHAGLFSAQRHQPAAECVSCHMPRLRPTNVAHSAVTDHSIPRIAHSQPRESATAEFALKAWRDADASLARRDLGLAYFDLAANTHFPSALRQAYEILAFLPADQRRDAPVEVDLASMLLQRDQVSLATQLFARAAAQEPSNPRYAYCLGAALSRSGKFGEAIKELQRAIDLDPSQPDPYLELSQLYAKAGEPSASRQVIGRYLEFMPQNIRLRSLIGDPSFTSGRIR